MGNNYTTADSLKTVEELAGAQSTKVTEENVVETLKTNNNMEQNNQSADSLKTVEELAGAQSTKVAEGNTVETSNDTPKKVLEEDKVYSLSKMEAPFSLYRIASNRYDKKLTEIKIATCEDVGMLIPGCVTDAKTVLAAGYKLIDDNGEEVTKVTDSDYSITEGTTRYTGWLSSRKFEYKFVYHQFKTPEDMQKAYRQMNMYSVPTKGKDFARDFCATTDNDRIKFYNELIEKYKLIPKAAAIASVGKEFDSKYFEKAFSGKLPDFVSKRENTLYREPLTRSIIDIFTKAEQGEAVKLYPIAQKVPMYKWTAAHINDDTMDEDCKNLFDMFNGIEVTDFKVLSEMKPGSKGCTEDSVIKVLDNIYSKYLDKKSKK